MHFMDNSHNFSQTYREARGKFLEAARSARLAVSSYAHPLPGREGEELAMDAALSGPADAGNLLIITSATHGVEGFCGSGIQIALIRDPAFQARAANAGVAVLYVHGVNPWGFSWLRRWTAENVDLNRNCIDFSDPAGLPENPAYDAVADLLIPQRWPDPEGDRQLAQWIEKYGFDALKDAVSYGQYTYPDGLFFGGAGPTWSNLTFRKVLRDFAQRCTRLACIDLHTGLGPEGFGEKILLTDDSGGKRERARRWWGDVTSLIEGNSVSSLVTGPLCSLLAPECPQAEITDIGLEYGTYPPDRMLAVLRADQWLYRTPDADTATHDAIKQQLLDAFYIDTDDWKSKVVRQCMTAADQAIAGLSSA